MKIDIFRWRSEAQTEKNKALVEKFKEEIAAAALQVQADIAVLEAEVSAYNAIQALRERLAESFANIAMQGFASSIGSINTNLGMSHQTGRDQSETFSHTESRGMSYNRDQSETESHPFEPKAYE